MKLKINNPRYSVEYNISRLVLDFLSLMSLTFFVYSLYVDKISIYILLRILMILLIIFIIRLLRKLIIHSLVCYMETLDEFTKFRIWLVTYNLWLKSNPLLYFMATNAELDIKIRRYLSHKRPFLKFFYKFILFIFYYPFTRLLYFHRRFMDKIIFENEDRLIYSRIEGYVIIWLILLPFIFPGNFNFIYLFYLYVFVLVFLFPILNCLKYLLVNLVVLLSPYLKKKEMKQDNTKSSLVRMSMSQTVSSLISSSGINASYPTVAWLVIRRAGNEKNLFGTIASLYFNNNWRSEANMRNMFYFYRAGFSCGTDSKRAIVWSLYYNKLVLKQLPGNVENNVYISYKWYDCLYGILNDDWWDAWMLEFFIQFANNNSKCKISDQYLQDMNNIIINHLSIMGQVFKLIWDIEKDWNIDPLSVRPECQLHLKKKGHSYPIYDDYFYLFANNSTIDGIKIPLQVYKQKSDSNTPKTFNRNLEEKLIQFLIDNHGAIKSRKAASGYWGMFYEHGKHLMDSFPITKDNLYDILVIKSFETAPYVKMQFRDDKVVAALNYFYYEGLYFHPYGIRQFVLNRLGSNIAKWRAEWEQSQLNYHAVDTK